jgi:hypothetical protein
MREACKYVEEKLATKVLILQCSVNNMPFELSDQGSLWLELSNNLFNVPLKFSTHYTELDYI